MQKEDTGGIGKQIYIMYLILAKEGSGEVHTETFELREISKARCICVECGKSFCYGCLPLVFNTASGQEEHEPRT